MTSPSPRAPGQMSPGDGMRTFTLELPPGTPIISGNNRMNRYERNRRTKNLHEHIKTAVRGIAPIAVPVDITVEYASPPRLVRLRHPFASECILDHDNLWPTYKACADGLVRAGLLAGDTKRYVRPGGARLADETHPRGLLRVTITEVPAPADVTHVRPPPHIQPKTGRECPYMAVIACNQCGWCDGGEVPGDPP